jgi:ABC-type dipeptide/oligopeptide/nickel transport system ATPase component
VEKLAIPFGPGLNAITGETGAGKSVLLSAIGLLAGARADREEIRAGFDRADVSARVVLPPPALEAVAPVFAVWTGLQSRSELTMKNFCVSPLVFSVSSWILVPFAVLPPFTEAAFPIFSADRKVTEPSSFSRIFHSCAFVPFQVYC